MTGTGHGNDNTFYGNAPRCGTMSALDSFEHDDYVTCIFFAKSNKCEEDRTHPQHDART